MSPVIAPEIRQYVNQVRAELAHLSDDDVDDLLSGLPANLAETVEEVMAAGIADGGLVDLEALLGTPREYATELCLAAGLDLPHRGQRITLRSKMQSHLDPVMGSGLMKSARDFLRYISPLWYASLGPALVIIVTNWRSSWGEFPLQEGWWWLLVLLSMVPSVRWTRRSSLKPKALWLKNIGRAMHVFAILLSLIMLDNAVSKMSSAGWSEGYRTAQQERNITNPQVNSVGMEGVWVDGIQVSNLFIYGPDGEPISGAQVFDDRGRPVRTVAADVESSPWRAYNVQGEWYFAPQPLTDGRQGWNVYPLAGITSNDMMSYQGQIYSGGSFDYDILDKSPMPWPFSKAPEVAKPYPTPPGAAGHEVTPTSPSLVEGQE